MKRDFEDMNLDGRRMNPWNQFQKDHKGEYTREGLREAYEEERAQIT
jgi:hypothetical protein